MIQHVHRHRINHGHLFRVVLEHEHHVEVLEVKLHPLKVHQLDVLERDHERRPFGQVDKRARRGLQQHRAAERGAREAQLPATMSKFGFMFLNHALIVYVLDYMF